MLKVKIIFIYLLFCDCQLPSINQKISSLLPDKGSHFRPVETKNRNLER
jgi:hypothetical protein